MTFEDVTRASTKSKYFHLVLLVFVFPLAVNMEVKASEKKNQAIRNMFTENMAVKKNERVLVFTDDYKNAITEEAKLVTNIGASYGKVIFHQYKNTGRSGMEPPWDLWEKAFGRTIVRQIEEKKWMTKLTGKTISNDELESVKRIVRANKQQAVQAVIGLAWFSASHTCFRELLTDSAEARFASMPAFDPRIWETAMSVNWQDVARKTLALKQRLSGAVSARVASPNETSILLDLSGREFKADTGLLDQPGRFGNLPGGEVYIAPVEERTHGRIVVEPGINPYVGRRVVLEVKDGRVTDMRGDSGFLSYLEGIFHTSPLARTVAEFGIGTNDKARIQSTILESEKVLGTIHFAIGDNSTMGGKISVPLHIDFVIEKPTVTVSFSDGTSQEIMRDGRLLVEI